MGPDQSAHGQADQDLCCSLLVSLLVVGLVSEQYPDQTARMRMLVWIHAGRKRIMLVLSWRSSNVNLFIFKVLSLWRYCPG
jgi:hypothetical protein